MFCHPFLGVFILTFHAVKVKVWALVALVSILSIGISACEGSNHFGKENTVQLTQEEEILPSDIELAKDSDMQELLTLRCTPLIGQQNRDL